MNKIIDDRLLNIFISKTEYSEYSVRMINSISSYVKELADTNKIVFFKSLEANIDYFIDKIDYSEVINYRSNMTFKSISKIFLNYFSKKKNDGGDYQDTAELIDNVTELCSKLESNFKNSKNLISKMAVDIVKNGDVFL